MKKWINRVGILALALVLFMGLFVPSNLAKSAQDEQKEAIVVGITGQVKILRGPWWSFWNWKDVRIGEQLFPGDRLKVGSNGGLELHFYNDTDVRVLANTTVVIGESTLTATGPGTEGRSSSILVKDGEVWVKVEKAVTKLLKFKVETPNVVAGVRGTAFIVKVGRGLTNVMVDNGIVEVKQRKSGAMVAVTGGYQTEVHGSKNPTEPVRAAENNRLKVKNWSDKVEKGDRTPEIVTDDSTEKNAKQDKEKDKKDKDAKKEEKDEQERSSDQKRADDSDEEDEDEQDDQDDQDDQDNANQGKDR